LAVEKVLVHREHVEAFEVLQHEKLRLVYVARLEQVSRGFQFTDIEHGEEDDLRDFLYEGEFDSLGISKLVAIDSELSLGDYHVSSLLGCTEKPF
jgi:hypothetical protein